MCKMRRGKVRLSSDSSTSDSNLKEETNLTSDTLPEDSLETFPPEDENKDGSLEIVGSSQGPRAGPGRRSRYSMNYQSYEATRIQPAEQTRRMLDYMFPGYQKRDPRNWYEKATQTNLNSDEVNNLIGIELMEIEPIDSEEERNRKSVSSGVGQQAPLEDDDDEDHSPVSTRARFVAKPHRSSVGAKGWDGPPIRVTGKSSEEGFLIEIHDLHHHPQTIMVPKEVFGQKTVRLDVVPDEHGIPKVVVYVGDKDQRSSDITIDSNTRDSRIELLYDNKDEFASRSLSSASELEPVETEEEKEAEPEPPPDPEKLKHKPSFIPEPVNIPPEESSSEVEVKIEDIPARDSLVGVRSEHIEIEYDLDDEPEEPADNDDSEPKYNSQLGIVNSRLLEPVYSQGDKDDVAVDLVQYSTSIPTLPIEKSDSDQALSKEVSDWLTAEIVAKAITAKKSESPQKKSETPEPKELTPEPSPVPPPEPNRSLSKEVSDWLAAEIVAKAITARKSQSPRKKSEIPEPKELTPEPSPVPPPEPNRSLSKEVSGWLKDNVLDSAKKEAAARKISREISDWLKKQILSNAKHTADLSKNPKPVPPELEPDPEPVPEPIVETSPSNAGSHVSSPRDRFRPLENYPNEMDEERSKNIPAVPLMKPPQVSQEVEPIRALDDYPPQSSSPESSSSSKKASNPKSPSPKIVVMPIPGKQAEKSPSKSGSHASSLGDHLFSPLEDNPSDLPDESPPRAQSKTPTPKPILPPAVISREDKEHEPEPLRDLASGSHASSLGDRLFSPLEDNPSDLPHESPPRAQSKTPTPKPMLPPAVISVEDEEHEPSPLRDLASGTKSRAQENTVCFKPVFTPEVIQIEDKKGDSSPVRDRHSRSKLPSSEQVAQPTPVLKPPSIRIEDKKHEPSSARDMLGSKSIMKSDRSLNSGSLHHPHLKLKSTSLSPEDYEPIFHGAPVKQVDHTDPIESDVSGWLNDEILMPAAAESWVENKISKKAQALANDDNKYYGTPKPMDIEPKTESFKQVSPSNLKLPDGMEKVVDDWMENEVLVPAQVENWVGKKVLKPAEKQRLPGPEKVIPSVLAPPSTSLSSSQQPRASHNSVEIESWVSKEVLEPAKTSSWIQSKVLQPAEVSVAVEDQIIKPAEVSVAVEDQIIRPASSWALEPSPPARSMSPSKQSRGSLRVDDPVMRVEDDNAALVFERPPFLLDPKVKKPLEKEPVDSDSLSWVDSSHNLSPFQPHPDHPGDRPILQKEGDTATQFPQFPDQKPTSMAPLTQVQPPQSTAPGSLHQNFLLTVSGPVAPATFDQPSDPAPPTFGMPTQGSPMPVYGQPQRGQPSISYGQPITVPPMTGLPAQGSPPSLIYGQKPDTTTSQLSPVSPSPTPVPGSDLRILSADPTNTQFPLGIPAPLYGDSSLEPSSVNAVSSQASPQLEHEENRSLLPSVSPVPASQLNNEPSSSKQDFRSDKSGMDGSRRVSCKDDSSRRAEPDETVQKRESILKNAAERLEVMLTPQKPSKPGKTETRSSLIEKRAVQQDNYLTRDDDEDYKPRRSGHKHSRRSSSSSDVERRRGDSFLSQRQSLVSNDKSHSIFSRLCSPLSKIINKHKSPMRTKKRYTGSSYDTDSRSRSYGDNLPPIPTTETSTTSKSKIASKRESKNKIVDVRRKSSSDSDLSNKDKLQPTKSVTAGPIKEEPHEEESGQPAEMAPLPLCGHPGQGAPFPIYGSTPQGIPGVVYGQPGAPSSMYGPTPQGIPSAAHGQAVAPSPMGGQPMPLHGPPPRGFPSNVYGDPSQHGQTSSLPYKTSSVGAPLESKYPEDIQTPQEEESGQPAEMAPLPIYGHPGQTTPLPIYGSTPQGIPGVVYGQPGAPSSMYGPTPQGIPGAAYGQPVAPSPMCRQLTPLHGPPPQGFPSKLYGDPSQHDQTSLPYQTSSFGAPLESKYPEDIQTSTLPMFSDYEEAAKRRVKPEKNSESPRIPHPAKKGFPTFPDYKDLTTPRGKLASNHTWYDAELQPVPSPFESDNSLPGDIVNSLAKSVSAEIITVTPEQIPSKVHQVLPHVDNHTSPFHSQIVSGDRNVEGVSTVKYEHAKPMEPGNGIPMFPDYYDLPAGEFPIFRDSPKLPPSKGNRQHPVTYLPNDASGSYYAELRPDNLPYPAQPVHAPMVGTFQPHGASYGASTEPTVASSYETPHMQRPDMFPPQQRQMAAPNTVSTPQPQKPWSQSALPIGSATPSSLHRPWEIPTSRLQGSDTPEEPHSQNPGEKPTTRPQGVPLSQNITRYSYSHPDRKLSELMRPNPPGPPRGSPARGSPLFQQQGYLHPEKQQIQDGTAQQRDAREANHSWPSSDVARLPTFKNPDSIIPQEQQSTPGQTRDPTKLQLANQPGQQGPSMQNPSFYGPGQQTIVSPIFKTPQPQKSSEIPSSQPYSPTGHQMPSMGRPGDYERQMFEPHGLSNQEPSSWAPAPAQQPYSASSGQTLTEQQMPSISQQHTHHPQRLPPQEPGAFAPAPQPYSASPGQAPETPKFTKHYYTQPERPIPELTQHQPQNQQKISSPPNIQDASPVESSKENLPIPPGGGIPKFSDYDQLVQPQISGDHDSSHGKPKIVTAAEKKAQIEREMEPITQQMENLKKQMYLLTSQKGPPMRSDPHYAYSRMPTSLELYNELERRTMNATKKEREEFYAEQRKKMYEENARRKIRRAIERSKTTK